MQNEHDNPQSPRQGQQQGNQQPMDRPGQDRPMTPGENPRHRDEGLGRKHGQADGDGKVVKPGQKPGQSGGKGLSENR